VNDQRLEIVLGAKLEHLLAERIAEFVRSPLAWARREDLERIASETVGAFGGVVNASGGRGVNTDAAASEAGRPFGRGAREDVLFAGDRAGITKV